MSPTPRGEFVWHEVMTTDVAAAQQFYPSVTGWSTMPFADDPSYTMWTVGGNPVGGVMTIPDEAARSGAPPNWLTYIGTPSVDTTVSQAIGRGGKVLTGPRDIPGAGRFAVLQDPQGAVFAVYTSATASPPPGTPQPGEFSWHELATPDPTAALDFYRSLFGWDKTEVYDMGPVGPYQTFGLHGRRLGGIYPKPAEVPVANWLPYVYVKDVDVAARTATARGGTVMVKPMEVPGGDRIAIFADPQGAVIAVHALGTEHRAAEARKPESTDTAPKKTPRKKAAKKPRR